MYYNNLDVKRKKEGDIRNLIRFIEESTESIFKLIKDDRLNGGFFNVFEKNERKKFRLDEWVDDVRKIISRELNNLKKSLKTKQGINTCWRKMKRVGLTEVQLESKLNYWDRFFIKIREWLEDNIKIISNAFIYDFKNALKATNILYRTIVAMLPGFEPMVELKDYYELSLEMR